MKRQSLKWVLCFSHVFEGGGLLATVALLPRPAGPPAPGSVTTCTKQDALSSSYSPSSPGSRDVSLPCPLDKQPVSVSHTSRQDTKLCQDSCPPTPSLGEARGQLLEGVK